MSTPAETTDEVKADPNTVWVRSKHLLPVILATAAAVVCYMRFEYRMGRIEETIGRDASIRLSERDAIVKSVDGVRDQLRQVFIDSVATRQAQAWIEMARALNREKHPTIVWPDLPR